MPVHRHAHQTQGSVFAFKSEIEEWLRSRSPVSKKAQASARQRMLVVLPFQNLSGDPEHEVLADGFTEELIGQFGEVPRAQLGVIARTSAMLYKSSAKSVEEIASELNVDYVFEGSVRIQTERARVTGQLIRARDETHVWSRHYERAAGDALKLQEDISREIVSEVVGMLVGGPPIENRFAARSSPDVDRETFETYLKARSLLYRMTGDSIGRSIDCFEQVIEAAPDFAAAYAGLAEAILLATIWAPLPPKQTMPRALEAVLKAVSIDPRSAEAYAVLGFIHYSYTWAWSAAEAAFERAIRINPNLAVSYQWYAEFLAAMGRFDEAIARIEIAERLDPFSLAVATSRGHVLWLARDADALLLAMQKIVEIEPRYPLAHIFIILAHMLKGQFEESVASVYSAIELCGEDHHFMGFLGATAGPAGDTDLARRQLEKLDAAAKKNYVPQTMFCGPCIGAGDFDRALTHLENAFEEREWHIATLAVSNMGDPLRGHPRFCTLLERANLTAVEKPIRA